MPVKMAEVRKGDLEWFFNKEQGVIGIDGQPKMNPKVIYTIARGIDANVLTMYFLQCAYVSEVMKGVPQINYIPLGFEGWKKHLEAPYTRYFSLLFSSIRAL